MIETKKPRSNPFLDTIRTICEETVKELSPQIVAELIEDKLDRMVSDRVAAELHDLLAGGSMNRHAGSSKRKETRRKRPRCPDHGCAKNKTADGLGWFCKKCENEKGGEDAK